MQLLVSCLACVGNRTKLVGDGKVPTQTEMFFEKKELAEASSTCGDCALVSETMWNPRACRKVLYLGYELLEWWQERLQTGSQIASLHWLGLRGRSSLGLVRVTQLQHAAAQCGVHEAEWQRARSNTDMCTSWL